MSNKRGVGKLLLGFAGTAAVAVAVSSAGPARADVLLDETNLVGLPNVAAPSEYSFTASTAQALTLTLTDFQTPLAFGSLQVAVTLGDALIGSATADANTHVATLAIPAAAGSYTVHVIGTPTGTQGYGTFGVCVSLASAASCDASSEIAAYSFSGSILTPTPPSSTASSTLDTNFNSTVAGTYTVTLTDDAFPAALQSISGGVSQGSTPINSVPFALGQNQIQLAASTPYTLIIGAAADVTAMAGLYGISIKDPNGTVVFLRTIPVGTMAASTVVDNSATQTLSLDLIDLAYPSPLAGLGVAVTQGSTVLAQRTSAGTVTNFPATKGGVEIWQYAVAGAQPGVYSLNLASSASTLFLATTVVDTGNASTAQSFAFVATLPAAGTYNMAVDDFQFPATFQSLSATVAQNGAVLSRNSSGDFTAAAGTVIVVVNAQPPAHGNGIFAVEVHGTGTSAQSYLDQTQAVGGVFQSQTINLGTSGGFDVTLTDLGFPATFQDLAAVMSQGGKMLGSVTGGGTFSFNATPGEYVLTFVATPSTQNYGLYSLRAASSAPTTTLTSSASAVTSGGTVTLTWSSTNATACTAAGGTGWTGNQATSGSLAVIVSATETLNLTCTGPGGSASQSVTITATAAPASGGGGGGGAMDLRILGILAALLLLAPRCRAGRRRA